MLKRCNINVVGPEAKRLKIIRVSHKAPQGITNFDMGQFVKVFPSKALHNDDNILCSEADSSSSVVGLVEDVSSSIFDGGDAQDLVVELDCETVEMIDDGVTPADVGGSIADAESFSCLPDDENHNHRVEDEDDDKHESSPFMTHFVEDGGTGEALDLISNGVDFADAVVKEELTDIGDGFQGDVYNGEAMMVLEQPMDITEPLTTLKKLLEERMGCSLESHEVWLQDSVQLDPDRNLVSQCLEGSGVVQINVEIKSAEGQQNPRLNIIDVLKPVDDDEEEEEEEEGVRCQESSVSDETSDQMTSLANLTSTSSSSATAATLSSTTFVTKWVVDSWFCQEQAKLKIPRDPALWTCAHVKFWLCWAIKRFNLESVDSSLVSSVDGRRLISLSHDTFARIFPRDPGDVFWTHLELLRKCKFVAIMHSEETLATALANSSSSNANNNIYGANLPATSTTTTTASNRSHKSGGKARNVRFTLNSGDRTASASRFGNNGQIQLWQFLLELLTDKDYKDFIQWVGDNGEFKLVNPELIAQLWGHRKNKSTMNYEKLSRALRYYYDGDMIAKVHGRRFTYRYVCDLQTLLGYSVAELRQLVEDCAKRSKTHQDASSPYLHL